MRAGVLSVDFDGKARVYNLTVPLWVSLPGGGLGSAPGRALRWMSTSGRCDRRDRRTG